MNYILFEDESRVNLLPLTFTRPVAEIRVGILTIFQKWEIYIKSKPSYLTENYLSEKYKLVCGADNMLINGGVLPSLQLLEAINSLKPRHRLCKNGIVIAARIAGEVNSESVKELNNTGTVEFTGDIVKIEYPWDIFSKNGDAIKADYDIITRGRKSAPLSPTNQAINAENIFLEEGAVVECAILNASTGPIYIGKDAEIMEGSMVRGPFALCEHSALKLGAKIYGPTTIGPYSKVGGEVNNSVLIGFSNKGHDGFLGNSVLGEWCNLGADTNNSNLKNNYSEVKVWNYAKERFIPTGLTFCGLIMGDHSKSGINTMFNTGTVVGVSANIFGAGYPRNFIPSFSWGGAQGLKIYPQSQAYETARLVFERRGMVFNETEQRILDHVFAVTEKFRNF
jgi:UDP-N-acetylglucosamine diphosphorylase/glucosamine-1-phosphate N-acetyltransferase